MTTLDALFPAEIWIKILSLLSNDDLILGVARASMRFKCLGLYCVSELDFLHLQDISGTVWRRAHVKQLIEHCSKIRHLRLCQRFDPGSVIFAADALKSCPNLETLEWVNCRDEDRADLFRATCLNSKITFLTRAKLSGFKKNEKTCTQLLNRDYFCSCYTRSDTMNGVNTFLQLFKNSIQEVRLPRDVFGEDSYSALRQCRKMDKVRIEMSDDLSAAEIGAVLRLHWLKELDIYPNLHIHHSPFYRPKTDIFGTFSGIMLQELKYLRLYNCFHLDDEDLNTIVQSCPKVETLWLGPWLWITNEGVRRSILGRCKRLRKLILSGASRLSSNAFRDAKQHLPDLEHLCLESCYYWLVRDCRTLLRESGVEVTYTSVGSPTHVRFVEPSEKPLYRMPLMTNLFSYGDPHF